jgi:hypothetical protein
LPLKSRPRGAPARQADGLAVAEHELDRRPVEAELGPQLVLEIAPIAEVNRRRVVREEDEGRRCDTGLRPVEQLRAASLDDRRLLTLQGRPEDPVQLGRRDPLPALAPDVDRRFEDALDSLPGLRADREDRSEIEERRLLSDPVHVLVEGPV